eukprot:15144-Heterococcus_DN1.PRE.4
MMLAVNTKPRTAAVAPLLQLEQATENKHLYTRSTVAAKSTAVQHVSSPYAAPAGVLSSNHTALYSLALFYCELLTTATAAKRRSATSTCYSKRSNNMDQ